MPEISAVLTLLPKPWEVSVVIGLFGIEIKVEVNSKSVRFSPEIQVRTTYIDPYTSGFKHHVGLNPQRPERSRKRPAQFDRVKRLMQYFLNASRGVLQTAKDT